MKQLIRNVTIVGPKKVRHGSILIEDARIVKVGAVPSAAGANVIDCKGLLALPGFIDMHTHGALGFDATIGQYNPVTGDFDGAREKYVEGIPQVMRRFARSGVTRALLATLAAPEERLKNALSYLADYVEDAKNGQDGAFLEGACIEGTFLRYAERAGAQNPAYFLPQDTAIFDRLNKAARGTVRYVNAVTEYGKQSERFSRYLTRKGVLVGSGHTFCPADQVLRCAKAGTRVSVHFLNGAIGSSFKPFHGGNAVEAVLTSRDIYAEQICDGWHVSPRYVLDVIARKGFDRVVLVTDAMFVAGMKGIREFNVAGKEGLVHSSGEYLQVKGTDGTLFGSVLDMATGFGNLLSWLTRDMEGIWVARHPKMRLEDALVGVAQCASFNPAKLLGMEERVTSVPNAEGTGTLTPGKCADITLCELKGKPGDYKLRVKRTFVAGRQG